MLNRVEVVVVGAGWTGLATAAALRAFGVRDFILLESGGAPGAFWSETYDRIRLHTAWHGMPCDGGEAYFDFPMFKGRDDVLCYLKRYHTRHELQQHSRFQHRLVHAEQVREGLWRLDVDTPEGPCQYECRHLALCVSKLRHPYEPPLFGRHAHGAPLCIHSSQFRNGAEFQGRRVLVVGSGNSACEIALDLAECGAAAVSLLVCGPRQIVPLAEFGRLMHLARLEGTAACVEETVFGDWQLRYGEPGFAEACGRRSSLMRSIAQDTSAVGIKAPLMGFGEVSVSWNPDSGS